MTNEIPVRWKTALWNLITSRFDAVDSPIAAQSVVLDRVLNVLSNGLVRLENHLMTQDDAIEKNKVDSDAQLVILDEKLDNIIADEKNMLAVVATLKDMTPENQAKLDAGLAGIKARVAKATAIADSIPDQAPPVEP